MMKKVMLIGVLTLLFFLGATLLISKPKPNNEVSASDYSAPSIDFFAGQDVSYNDYKDEHEQTYPEETITIDATDYTHAVNTFNDEEVYVTDYEGVQGLYIPETVNVTWDLHVETSGYYNIKVYYVAPEGRSADISRGIEIDGEYPFTEAQNFVLSRIWQDAFNVADRRVEGKHDQKPRQLQKIRWNEEPITDSEGYYNGIPYQFYFEAGDHEITFIQDREPMIISTMTLYQKEAPKPYDETLANYETNGYEEIDDVNVNDEPYIKVQGENAFEKSSPVLAPVANWSSYKVDPYERFITRYNTIGGMTWRMSGEWISWKVNVPESGLYRITLKVNQNYSRGLVSTRTLRINGEIPFEEARTIAFDYAGGWHNITLGDDERDYLFYFEEGENVLSLESTIGVYNDIIRHTEQTIQTLNEIYRQVIMITGANPDEYQDYMLQDRIPELSDMIDDGIERLEYAQSEIIDIAGERSSLITSFEKTLYQLRDFSESEKNIQIGLNELDDNIAALGTWVTQISEQPLGLDAIYVHGEDAKIPKASTNIFQKIWHEFVMLIGSYGRDTTLKSTVEVDGPTITVWIMTGRDQSRLLRQIIDEQFTIPKSINVEMRLVSQTALLPATLSGNGPDVALGVLQNIPVNWGIRNAVEDLSEYPGFDDVRSRFHQSAMTPFEFRDSVYAVPETQDFLMTFIRTDIVADLDIEVPETWKEVINLLPGLQRQHLDYYLPSTNRNFQNIFVPQVTTSMASLMYSMLVQNGGQLYEADGRRTLLLEEESIESFIDFTNFFSDFGFAIEANFANRFRSGEMPLGVYNYSLYNTLAVFAPEIRGKWDFAPIPGYEKDGVIHNQTTSTATGVVILEDSKEKEASWEFVKWWTSEEAQTSFGRGLEAILGAAARYPTANLEAFSNLPWSTRDYYMLDQQRDNAVGIPTVPGDYIIGRYMDYAFRATVNDGTNPRDNLYKYVTKIDQELERKREEFNLD